MGFWSKIFGSGGSYFLEDEAAKGLGDTEYMKQSKAVRRTFPGSAGGEDFEVTQQVSAMDKATFDSRKGGAAPAPRSASSSSSSFGASSFGSSSFGASSFSSSSFGGGAASAESAAETSATGDEVAPTPEFQPSRSTNVDTGMDMFRNMAKKIGR